MKPRTVSLRGRGWAVIGPCVAVIRLSDQPGFAVGWQASLRSDGVGRVWPTLRKARHRARYLADLHSLPIAEAI